MSYPTAAANAKVTIISLAANSPEYSVPLTAAVTYVLYIFNNEPSRETKHLQT